MRLFPGLTGRALKPVKMLPEIEEQSQGTRLQR